MGDPSDALALRGEIGGLPLHRQRHLFDAGQRACYRPDGPHKSTVGVKEGFVERERERALIEYN